MTAKEKALELVNKYFNIGFNLPTGNPMNVFIDCALIAVDEILNYSKGFDTIHHINGDVYWQQVRKEIELMKPNNN